MDNDRVKAHLVEVAKGAAKDIDVVGKDGAADLDDSELLRGDRLELRQVLLHLAYAVDCQSLVTLRASKSGLRLVPL